ncbi:14386_t:CDS:2 [Dentiscutata heterogama]|uniref:14386_t:CDS:1 n=1 Tax=Dentiscutata heterogama TaxID=1316150 RepID=A0ACA9JUX5_9GLOM|nr:14386_t:CDS:2 [Dentiscutata heterogama]
MCWCWGNWWNRGAFNENDNIIVYIDLLLEAIKKLPNLGPETIREIDEVLASLINDFNHSEPISKKIESLVAQCKKFADNDKLKPLKEANDKLKTQNADLLADNKTLTDQNKKLSDKNAKLQDDNNKLTFENLNYEDTLKKVNTDANLTLDYFAAKYDKDDKIEEKMKLIVYWTEKLFEVKPIETRRKK